MPETRHIVSVVGARPQFIKAAAISRAIAGHNRSNSAPVIEEILVHTGQHYDDDMSAIFFRELDIPEPKYNLNIGSDSHGWGRAQTTHCPTWARKVERLSNDHFAPRRTQGVFRVRICQKRARQHPQGRGRAVQEDGQACLGAFRRPIEHPDRKRPD